MALCVALASGLSTLDFGANDCVIGHCLYISSAQAELDEVAVGATTPARVSVVTSESFLDPTKPPASVQGFAQAQEYVVRDPVHVRWPEITQRIYNPKMDLLWGGTETAANVAQMIKDEADPLFAG